MVEQPNNHLPNNQNDQNNGDNNDIEMLEMEDNFSDNEEDSYPESEEFESIDNQLDVLNTALDDMEQKNDNILAELTTLLDENREIRKQLQECRVENPNSEVPPQANN